MHSAFLANCPRLCGADMLGCQVLHQPFGKTIQFRCGNTKKTMKSQGFVKPSSLAQPHVTFRVDRLHLCSGSGRPKQPSKNNGHLYQVAVEKCDN